MDEAKIEILLEQLKRTAESAKEGVKKAAKNAVKKGNSVVGLTKMYVSISETEESIKNEYAKIGKIVYDGYSDEKSAADDISKLCGRIDKLKAELETMRKRVAELRGKALCPECGAYNDENASFCSECGAPIDGGEKSEESENVSAGETDEDSDESFAEHEAERETITLKPRKRD